MIERLDRKLDDSTGSNTVEKCDVVFSRAIQPLTSDDRWFARLIFHRLFQISVFNYTDCPCYEVKDEVDLLLENKQLEGTKLVKAKDRVNKHETCESEE